jgi:AGZA family xanthine/uracil permease-like MFS transporter
MAFTFNIGVGMTAGFLLYPFCKVVARKNREVRSGMWILAGFSLLFYVFYPYGSR